RSDPDPRGGRPCDRQRQARPGDAASAVPLLGRRQRQARVAASLARLHLTDKENGMAQQPNVEISPWDLPAPVLEPSPARRQKTRRPGVILDPDDMPESPWFGTPGPDTGFALRIISQAGVAEDDARLRTVLAALMGARASHFGRAPTRHDLD